MDKRILGKDLDLYYIHRIDEKVPIEETAGAMKELIEQGKITHWVLSEANEEIIRRAHKICPVTAIQNRYSRYKAFLKDRLSFQLFIYDLFGTNDSHMIAHFGKIKEMVYDGLSTSKVSLTVRYKFNTTRSKYKGTGAGESQKNRM